MLVITDVMKEHRYAMLFPMLPKEKLQELADDIKANGQQQPIIRDQEQCVVDGRNRWRACHMAGVEPKFETKHFADDMAVLAYITSANLHRRHLTTAQRARIAANIANAKRGGDRRSKYQSANLHDDPKPTVSIAEAAKMMDVSERSAKSAKKIAEKGTPKLNEAVDSGKIKLNTAEKIAALPTEEQDEATEQVLQGKPMSGGKRTHNSPEPIAPTVTVALDRRLVRLLGDKYKTIQRLAEKQSSEPWQMVAILVKEALAARSVKR